MISKNKLFSKKLSIFPELVQGILVGRLMFRNNDPEEVIANRKRAFAGLGIDLKKVVIQRQEHGNKVRVVGEKDRGAGVFDAKTYLRGTDGMITDKPNLFLAVHTADCVPVSFYDPRKKIIAIAHAGWKGTAERVGQGTVLEMKKVFSCDAEDIIVYIGPSIGPCCYNVAICHSERPRPGSGESRNLSTCLRTKNLTFVRDSSPSVQNDVYIKISQFKKAFPGCVYRKAKGIYLDIFKANKKQLLQAGILEKNIEESKICTCCSKYSLPSHYREKEKRNRSILSVIGMKEL